VGALVGSLVGEPWWKGPGGLVGEPWWAPWWEGLGGSPGGSLDMGIRPLPANSGTRARAPPRPSLRPLQVLLAHGEDSVCYYTFFGAEEMDFGLSEISNVEIRF
jgi:hypothetical protein